MCVCFACPAQSLVFLCLHHIVQWTSSDLQITYVHILNVQWTFTLGAVPSGYMLNKPFRLSFQMSDNTNSRSFMYDYISPFFSYIFWNIGIRCKIRKSLRYLYFNIGIKNDCEFTSQITSTGWWILNERRRCEFYHVKSYISRRNVAKKLLITSPKCCPLT